MSDPQLHVPPPSTPVQKSGCGKPILFGCLGIAALALIATIGGIYWAATKGKDFLTDAAREAIVSEINNSDLPESQRQGLTSEIDRLAAAYSSGQVSMADLADVMEEIETGPVMTTIKFYSAVGNPIITSNLSPEEREAAFQTMNRFVVGVFDERIPSVRFAQIFEPLLEDPNDLDNLRYRSDITEAELQSALQQAEMEADNAGIEESDVFPDIAGRLRRIVDRIVKQP